MRVAGMVLQIHDELVVECREELAPLVERIVRERMCATVKLNVKLRVRTKIGRSWAFHEMDEKEKAQVEVPPKRKKHPAHGQKRPRATVPESPAKKRSRL